VLLRRWAVSARFRPTHDGVAVITAADSEFHERDRSIANWAETIVLIFSVPEAGIMGNAYVLARPNLGVAAASVIVFQGFKPKAHQIDFSDARMHQPCPESFLDMSFPDMGYRVQTLDAPRDFRFSYDDPHGACRFDLTFKALHEPFDTHDPAQNPLIEAGGTDMGYGDAWANGHLDVIGHTTGTLELRGKEYEVDCYDGMDRSWGPREEWGGRAVTWVHITFGAEFGLHLALTMDRDETGHVIYDQLRFGYLHDHGRVVGITEARMSAERVDMVPVSNSIWCKDAEGNEHEFRGTAVAGCPWYQFIPAYVCMHTLMRYEDKQGRVGHAEHGDIFGMEWLGDRYSSHARIGAGVAR
jgi:hypothetical protein